MLPIIYAIISCFLYATQMWVLSTALNRFSATALLFIGYGVAMPIVAIRNFFSSSVVWPHGKELWFAAGAGLVYLFADAFMAMSLTGAETAGRNMVIGIGLLSLTIPLWLAIFALFNGRHINMYHGVAFLAGALMLFASLKASDIGESQVETSLDSSH